MSFLLNAGTTHNYRVSCNTAHGSSLHIHVTRPVTSNTLTEHEYITEVILLRTLKLRGWERGRGLENRGGIKEGVLKGRFIGYKGKVPEKQGDTQ